MLELTRERTRSRRYCCKPDVFHQWKHLFFDEGLIVVVSLLPYFPMREGEKKRPCWFEDPKHFCEDDVGIFCPPIEGMNADDFIKVVLFKRKLGGLPLLQRDPPGSDSLCIALFGTFDHRGREINTIHEAMRCFFS